MKNVTLGVNMSVFDVCVVCYGSCIVVNCVIIEPLHGIQSTGVTYLSVL